MDSSHCACCQRAVRGDRALLDVCRQTSETVPCRSELLISSQSLPGGVQHEADGSLLPHSVQERLLVLAHTAHYARPKQSLPDKPTSFGVYLGTLSVPVAPEERRVLEGWDMIVLDPRQLGVIEAVNDESIALGPHIIARLDLLAVLPFSAKKSEIDMLKAVHLVSLILNDSIRLPHQQRYCTGVLIAGWKEQLCIRMLNGLAKLFHAYGLDVYLEVTAPDFLNDVGKLNYKLFAGMTVRNGTIMRDGKRRDYFAMENMKTTTKTFVSQACLRPFLTMMWDTIDDDADVSHAVTRRAHMWCSYHGAIPYFARQCALRDISEVRSCEEPLAAFQWLKERRVMAVHDRFRTSRIVS